MFFGRKQEITHADTTVRARAKINLTLDVTGRREDGYHTVEMVMQSIALHDTVRVTTIHGEKKPRGIVLSCSLPFLPTDERNLAYRAAELFYKETGALLETCEIHIEKRIPVAAGLAGGSTDAAAVLRALNALHTAGLTDDELCEMGLKLGADVPFCIDGGAAAAAGIGEKLTPVESHLPLWLVITKPKAGCSTPAMYRRIDEMGESLRQRFTTQEAAKALEKGDLAGLCGSLYNVFEEVTALPDLSEIRQELRQSGALAAMMTGSGSAVFGIFPEEDAAKVAAEKMAESRWAICCRGIGRPE